MKTTELLWGILTSILLSFAVSCTEEEKEPPVGGTVTDENGPITLELADITATTALFKGSVNLDLYSKYDEVGIIYSLTENLEMTPLITNIIPITNIDKNNRFEKKMSGLLYNMKYYYSSYICMNGIYEFGEIQSFTTDDVKIEVSAPTVTSTTATFTGKVTIEEDDLESLSFGVAWSSDDEFSNDVNEEEVGLDDDGAFVLTVEGLKMGKEYYYAPYICQLDSKYGGVKMFTTAVASMSVSASEISQTSVTFTGKAEINPADESIEYGILYSTDPELEAGASGCVRKVLTDVMSTDGNYSLKVDGLVTDTKYYYCWYACQDGTYTYGNTNSFATLGIVAQDLSINGTANCYIISGSGKYKIKAVKGNSDESVGDVASSEILWESFGTDITPNIGDLIRWVSCNKTEIVFEVPSDFKEGNAVIAAKDASGNILWSWHIWLTDQPQGQEYYNGAGTMMDRNLGATSATPGDVGALGLLYQWGRKDPFLGSSSISSNTVVKSTISWPSSVSTSSSRGTVSYVVANPTTFVSGVSSSYYDWHYSSRNNTLWTTSDKTKSIYDPCPVGWRVPDGGDNGVWSKALGSSSSFTQSSLYNSSNEGMNFSGKFGNASTIWYPASGYRLNDDGALDSVGSGGYYWSASPFDYFAYVLKFDDSGYVGPSRGYIRAYGQSVRCLQE